MFRDLEKAEPDDLSKRVVRRRGAIFALCCLGGIAGFLGLLVSQGQFAFGKWMMVFVFPLTFGLLGLLQAITGLPLHRLDQMWNELEESEQRLIVYGLFFGIPIATVVIAYRHC
jgi:hypothetical protein